MKSLLELRNSLKSKKPSFKRRYAGKIKRLKSRWTKPRGKSNKVRLKKIGKPKGPSIGYRSPKKVRALSKNGLIPVIIHSLNQLTALNSKEIGVIISKEIGLKKKIQILEKCQQLNLKVINVKNIENFIKTKKEEFLNKQKEKKTKEKKKVKSKEEALKKAEEKKQPETKTEEEKKEEQKKIEKESLKKEFQTKKEKQPAPEKIIKPGQVKQKIIPGEK